MAAADDVRQVRAKSDCECDWCGVPIPTGLWAVPHNGMLFCCGTCYTNQLVKEAPDDDDWDDDEIYY